MISSKTTLEMRLLGRWLIALFWSWVWGMYTCVSAHGGMKYGVFLICSLLCVCVHVCMCICVSLCVCTSLCVYMCFCVCTSVCICTYMCVSACMCVCLCEYICVCMCVYICACNFFIGEIKRQLYDFPLPFPFSKYMTTTCLICTMLFIYGRHYIKPQPIEMKKCGESSIVERQGLSLSFKLTRQIDEMATGLRGPSPFPFHVQRLQKLPCVLFCMGILSTRTRFLILSRWVLSWFCGY